MTENSTIIFQLENGEVYEIPKEKYYPFYPHFAQRLKERYSIDITFDEFIELSRVPELIKSKRRKDDRGKFTRTHGYLEIKGQKVRVIRMAYMTFKPLLSAFPL